MSEAMSYPVFQALSAGLSLGLTLGLVRRFLT